MDEEGLSQGNLEVCRKEGLGGARNSGTGRSKVDPPPRGDSSSGEDRGEFAAIVGQGDQIPFQVDALESPQREPGKAQESFLGRGSLASVGRSCCRSLVAWTTRAPTMSVVPSALTAAWAL